MASSPRINTQLGARQTLSFEERPVSPCPSSLRVLRRQGAAKHKRR